MKNLLRCAGAMALALLASPCLAQTASTIQAPAGFAPMVSPCVKQSDASCTPVAPSNPLPTDTIIRSTATDRGAVVGTTAQTLIPLNLTRRGFAVQVQSTTANCYINGQTAASSDYHSLLIVAGGYYETAPTHVGTSAISVICTAVSTPVYIREW